MELNKGVDFFPLSKYGLTFRLVCEEDATFILKLRNDPKLSLHLNKTSSRYEDQIKWIKKYKEREQEGKEYYILCFDSVSNNKLGLNRLYNLTSGEFEIGSWLFLPNLNISTAILGDLMARSFAFEVLNYKICVFNVRKTNKTVLRYHLAFNPDKIGEDEQNFFFRLTQENFTIQKNKLLKIIGYDQSK